jgi:5-methylcytosine-specific restriction endonuclease McrA
MSRLSLTRDKIYKTVARQLHGQVPCWVCGEHVLPGAATLEHILPLSEGGNSHAENLAISHEVCNGQRHAKGAVVESLEFPGQVARGSIVK